MDCLLQTYKYNTCNQILSSSFNNNISEKEWHWNVLLNVDECFIILVMYPNAFSGKEVFFGQQRNLPYKSITLGCELALKSLDAFCIV